MHLLYLFDLFKEIFSIYFILGTLSINKSLAFLFFYESLCKIKRLLLSKTFHHDHFQSSVRGVMKLKTIHLKSSIIKGVKISQTYQENTCATALPETLLKKRLWHKSFSVNFVKL